MDRILRAEAGVGVVWPGGEWDTAETEGERRVKWYIVREKRKLIIHF